MLVQCDAAQLEWRVLAWLSGDPIAIEELNEGLDTHTRNQEAFNLPSRLISKIYLFRTIYRGSGWSFANDPDFMHVSDDPAFWDGINEKFYKKYKGTDKWHNSLAQLVASHKPIISPLGREWLILPKQVERLNRYTGQTTVEFKIPWTVLTNYPVQGTGNDLMAVARVSVLRRMRKLGLRSLLISTVHDSIVIDCVPEEVDTVVDLLYAVFDDLPKNLKKLWSVNVPIAFPCEVKVGPNLKDMIKVPKST